VVSVGVAAAFAADKGQVDGFGEKASVPAEGQLSGNVAGVAVGQASGRVYVVDAAGGFGNPSWLNIFTASGDFISRTGGVGPEGGKFSEFNGDHGPRDVAASPGDGSVYVTEASAFGHARVQKFDSAGSFELAWGWGVLTGASEFEICTVAESCLDGLAGSGAGQFGGAGTNQVAVDPQSPHHVFVSDPANRRIQEFTAAGTFVRGMGWGVRNGADEFQTCTTTCQAGSTTAGTEPGRFGASRPIHLAVGTGGVLYASDSTASNRVQRIDLDAGSDAAMPMAPIGGDGPLLAASTVGMAFDAATDNLLVARRPGGAAETVVQEVDEPAGVPVVVANHASGEGWVSGAGTVEGVDVNWASGDVYVSRPGPGEVSVLNIGSAPDVTLQSTTDVTSASATVRASVDPNGARVLYAFEYRPVGEATWSSVGGRIPRSDTPSQISEVLTGLSPGTDYEVRLTADGFGPPIVRDTTGDFSTVVLPPTIVERPAAPVSATTALLQAQINPNSRATAYRFEWGSDTNYSETPVPVPDGALPAVDERLVVTELLTGLDPNTTYHFRVVADNGVGGVQTGEDQTFTTKPDIDCVRPPCPLERGYELVSPADKFGGIGVGYWYEGFGHMASSGLAAHAGERFIVEGQYGSTLDGGAAFSYGNDLAFTERVGNREGWHSHTPLTHTNLAPSLAQFVGIRATSATFGTSVLDSRQTLAIWPELVGGGDPSQKRPSWQQLAQNGFFVDWGGLDIASTWELFGPTSLDNVRTEGTLWDFQLSADGSVGVAQTGLESGLSNVYGVAGPGDPTWPAFGDLVSGRSIYLGDVSDGPADTFEGTGARRLVNVCTGDGASRTVLPAVAGDGELTAQVCPAAGPGRDDRLISDRGAALTYGQSVSTDVVSRDGSRVFFLSPDRPSIDGSVPKAGCSGTGAGVVCPPQLYVRQRNADGSVTVRWISKAEDGLFGKQDASLTGQVSFEGATPDGGSVFFRTRSPLTLDDPNGAGAPVPGGVKTGVPHPESWDLYRYDLPDDPAVDPGDGTLTRISAGPDGDGDCNSPVPELVFGGIDTGEVGALRFASEDGRRVYFTCAAPLGDLDGDVNVPANGTITTPGGDVATSHRTNLYLYDENLPAGERWRFLARLPRAAGNSLDTCASTGTVRRSPFSASRIPPITLLEAANSNCVNGTGDGAFVTLFTTGRLTEDDPDGVATGDVYGYDAESDELVRLSAPRSGDPDGYSCTPDNVSTSVDESVAQCYGDGGADIGGTKGLRQALGVATDPLEAGDRVAFFQSRARLVSDDVDDTYDVYQWRNGELSLITSGQSDTHGALYKGNDRTGRNVYFVTRDRYSWQDFDAVADIYTARVGGGILEPVPPAACNVTAGGCQSVGGIVGRVRVDSTAPGGSNAGRDGRRRVLRVGRPSVRGRRRAARTGVVVLRIRVGQPAQIRAVARARLAKQRGRGRVVAVGRTRARRAGVAAMRMRLRRPAIARLRSGRRLVVAVRVDARGFSPTKLRFSLRRAGR
jgi:hypothetical protein